MEHEPFAPADLGGLDDKSLARIICTGKAAERRLVGSEPAPDAKQRITAATELALGLQAWTVLFERHRPTLDRFCQAKRLPASGRQSSELTAEEFASFVWTKVWEQHKIRSWASTGSFAAWYRTVLRSLWSDWYKQQGRTPPFVPLSDLWPAGDAEHSPSDVEAHREETEATEDDAREALVTLAGRHDRAVRRLVMELRIVYRLAHVLPLDQDEREYAAKVSSRSSPECDEIIDKLYERYLATASGRTAESWLELERRYEKIVELERELRELNAERERLLGASDVVVIGAEGSAKTTWSVADAVQTIGERITTVQTTLDRERREWMAARERGLSPLRVSSREIAGLLKITTATVDQRLHRAHLAIQKSLLEDS